MDGCYHLGLGGLLTCSSTNSRSFLHSSAVRHGIVLTPPDALASPTIAFSREGPWKVCWRTSVASSVSGSTLSTRSFLLSSGRRARTESKGSGVEEGSAAEDGDEDIEVECPEKRAALDLVLVRHVKSA